MTWVQACARDLSSLANEVHGLVDKLAADDAAKLAKIDALTAERDALRIMVRDLAKWSSNPQLAADAARMVQS